MLKDTDTLLVPREHPGLFFPTVHKFQSPTPVGSDPNFEDSMSLSVAVPHPYPHKVSVAELNAFPGEEP